jgi:hypothetical protein
MAAALAKVSPTQQLVKARASAAMKRVQNVAMQRRHTVAVTVLAAGVGFYEKGGKTLPSFIDGVPAKLQLAVLAAIVADNTSGETSRYAQAMCDGMAAIVGYQFGHGDVIGSIGADHMVDV